MTPEAIPSLSDLVLTEVPSTDKQPSALPSPLFSVEQIKAMECDFASVNKTTTFLLMQRAGTAAFNLMRQLWPNEKHIVVLCGKGNNAGDGFILALLAAQASLRVDVVELFPDHQPKNDSALAYQALKEHFPGTLNAKIADLENCDLIVDAMLGTGLRGKLSEPIAGVIKHANASGLPIFSLDIPSGLHADTGSAPSGAVNAQATVSFIGLKKGMVTADGLNHCGDIYLNTLDALPGNSEEIAEALWSKCVHYRSHWPRRLPNSHKGHFGHLAVVAGSPGLLGAARLSASSALRLGAGLVSVGTHPEQAIMVNANQPELMVFPLDEATKYWQKSFRAVVVGPGLGQDAWAFRQWQEALALGLPCVLDADALNFLAQEKRNNENWVLTPHPGEAARLLNSSTEAVQSDRFLAAKTIVRQYGGVCVLKGAGTIIATQSETHVLAHGHPAMATAGMGDVLAGAIGALLAQGLGVQQAALLGCLVHSASAEHYINQMGPHGLVASEIVTAMPKLLNEWERECQ